MHSAMGPYGTQDKQEERQVCVNGHVINNAATSSPKYNRAHCPKCGAATITQCVKCHGVIPGGKVMFADEAPLPSFCVHCGEPLPWTQSAFDQATELFDLIDDLSGDEKQALKACLPHLVSDSPSTPIAALKTGKLMKRLEPHLRDAFKQVIYSLMAAKTQALLKPYGF